MENQLKSQSSMRVSTRGQPLWEKYKNQKIVDPKLGQGCIVTTSAGGSGIGQGGCSGDSGGPLFCNM